MFKNNNRKNSEVVNSNINELSKIIDVNSVIGKPIITQSNATVIPVSKLTVAYLGGNGEYGSVNIFASNTHPSASGNGGIVNVNPIGFLYIDGSTCKYVKTNDDTVDLVFDKATDFLKKAIDEKN